MDQHSELQSAHPATTGPSSGTQAPRRTVDSPAHRSWPGKALLLAVAIAGAVGLVLLAYHVTTPESEGNGGIIVHSEVISLWMHPALFDLAQRPEDVAACRSLEGFRRYAEERGLQKAWYVLTVKGIQVDGGAAVMSMIRWPYELVEPSYAEFPDMLATAAGKPPRHPMTDFTKVKVRVIPTRFLDADPRAVLYELRMLEHSPARMGHLLPQSALAMVSALASLFPLTKSRAAIALGATDRTVRHYKPTATDMFTCLAGFHPANRRGRPLPAPVKVGRQLPCRCAPCAADLPSLERRVRRD